MESSGAMPFDAEFPEPKDCPTLESHLLKAPKPSEALDDVMEAIEGDGTPWSYLAASLLRRELSDFGAAWHGVHWSLHFVLDEDPWMADPPKPDDPPLDRPTTKAVEWTWLEGVAEGLASARHDRQRPRDRNLVHVLRSRNTTSLPAHRYLQTGQAPRQGRGEGTRQGRTGCHALSHTFAGRERPEATCENLTSPLPPGEGQVNDDPLERHTNMNPLRALRLAAVLMLSLGVPNASLAADKDQSAADVNADKGTTQSVDARVDYPADGGVGILAEKHPGSFTIPKGSAGTKLDYEFFDPKSGTRLTKLNGRNVYSVTEHRYVDELDKDPDFQLPPGDYKFVVGGQPGATGRLRYTTVPSPDKPPPPKGAVRTIDASVDYPTDGGIGIQAEKQPGSFTIPKGSAGTKLDYEFFDPKSGTRLTKLNGRNVYSVTEHRYMGELDKDPDFPLPPGDYRFVVGGQPGATGRLRFTEVPFSGPKPPPTTTVQKDGRCPYCGQYHNVSHTSGTSGTNQTSPPVLTTTRPPLSTPRYPPPRWTTRISSSQTTKTPPPSMTNKSPPQTTKNSPPSSTTRKPPPQQTTKTSPPPQTTKKAGPVSLDENNPNYIKKVLKNSAIQKRPN